MGKRPQNPCQKVGKAARIVRLGLAPAPCKSRNMRLYKTRRRKEIENRRFLRKLFPKRRFFLSGHNARNRRRKHCEFALQMNAERRGGKNRRLQGRHIFRRQLETKRRCSEFPQTVVAEWIRHALSLQIGNIAHRHERKHHRNAGVEIGFRSVKLAMNSGAWNEPKEEIKTRSVPPMQLVVNGKKYS